VAESAGVNADERAFAAVVRRARERTGWPQGRIAEAMNAQGWRWHQSTVARVESGKQAARLGEAVALAEILGIDLSDFLAGNSAPWLPCVTCDDKPPSGFTCDTCSKSGKAAT
jgi:transcriptional regulator with XRE-family HTH domain